MKRWITMLVALLGVLWLISISILIGANLDADSSSLHRLLYDRTLNRFEDKHNYEKKYFHEDFDEPIIEFLLDHPEKIVTGVGLGNAHLAARPYLQEVIARYAGEGVFVSKRGYLRLISEVGLIGLLLLCFWFFFQFSRSRAVAIYNAAAKVTILAVTVVCFGFFWGYMASGQLASHFYLSFGAVIALENLH